MITSIIFDKIVKTHNIVLKKHAVTHLLITADADYQNSSRSIDVSILLSTGLSCSFNRLYIILILRTLLSVVKIENSSKVGE